MCAKQIICMDEYTILKTTRGQQILGFVFILVILAAPLIGVFGDGAPTAERFVAAFYDSRFYYSTNLMTILTFCVAYDITVPRYFMCRKYAKFFAITFVVFLISECIVSYINCKMGWKFVFNGTGLIVVLIKLLSNILVVFVAVGFRALQANTELKKEVLERRNFQIQAELEQLKSQLNPHFLFNTLNNISSLSTFDTDATQLSISKLSDMLRYVIYDTTSPKVELKKEIDFIMNYVDLMKLRYDESTLSVNVSVNVANMQCKIAPMLYISIVENAFKYGASSKVNSSIDIDVSEDDSAITFVVTNTLLKDSEVNNAHKGGVGISNLKKRLDIIYPACYEYTYGLTGDGKYRASIKLFNLKKI